ncbi:MAG: Rieske 2Fe-2S domain-containing protein, partial [Burkholderiales bacterium]
MALHLPRVGDRQARQLHHAQGGWTCALDHTHADGVVRAFFNACTHRGNVVCREKSGSARAFMCFYHAWTFNQ